MFRCFMISLKYYREKGKDSGEYTTSFKQIKNSLQEILYDWDPVEFLLKDKIGLSWYYMSKFNQKKI